MRQDAAVIRPHGAEPTGRRTRCSVRRFVRRPFAVALAALAFCGAALADAPPIPPGLDPGGIAVALIGSGIDYTKPEIAARIARDGEGVPVAWNFEADNAEPFDRDGNSALVADKLAAKPGVSLIPIREAPQNPMASADATAFAVQTPARILFLTDLSPTRPDWRLIELVARQSPSHIVVVSAGGGGIDLDAVSPIPGSQPPPNLVIVTSAPSLSPGAAAAPAPNHGRRVVTLAVRLQEAPRASASQPTGTAAAPVTNASSTILAAAAFVELLVKRLAARPDLPAAAVVGELLDMAVETGTPATRHGTLTIQDGEPVAAGTTASPQPSTQGAKP